jgi:hypothetical protein
LPGAPFLYASALNAPEGMHGSQAQSMSTGGASHTAFIIWLAILGVIVPVVILGGLRVGGFSFVFKSR